MSDAYALLNDLRARLDWQLSDDEAGMAEAALEDASNEARFYGKDWPVESVPPMVKTLVLRAVVRYMRNPEDYVSSRAGDESVTWTDRGERLGAPTFLESEIAILARMAGSAPDLYSVPTPAWGSGKAAPTELRLPVASGGDNVPLFVLGPTGGIL